MAEQKQTENKLENQTSKRWFSTGFQVGGVGAVDGEKHILQDAVVIRTGEALGHDLWIDDAFCQSVVAMSAEGKFATSGIKARFGHPNMCGEALGTFLGRWRNLRTDDAGRVIGDLHLSSVAAESPRGDLRNYIEELAAKEPEHFGASIVFARDVETELQFTEANSNETDGFKSPDPANEQNLRHARLSELHAADLVDEPAATDGMFSGLAGTALAAQVTEWLDLHPEVLTALSDEPVMSEIILRYPEHVRPFLARYAGNKELASGAEPPLVNAETAESVEAIKTELETLKGSATEAGEKATAEIERLTGECSGVTVRAETADASIKTLEAERDELTAQLKTANEATATALARIAAFENGAPPLSSVPAPEGPDVTPWKKAQLASRNRK